MVPALPNEILSFIVSLAREQDERLERSLQSSRDRVSKPMKEVMALSSWYGRSLLALHATSRTFASFAKPHIFESIKLSLTQRHLFRDVILPNYAPLIKTVVFDIVPWWRLSDVFEAFLHTSVRLPALQCLNFETPESIAELQWYAGRAFSNGVEGDDNHEQDPDIQVESEESVTADKRHLRPILELLSERITRLICLRATCSQIGYLSRFFLNLTYLKRRLLGSPEDALDDAAERELLADLEQLEELDISTLDHADTIGLKRFKYRSEEYRWSDQWMTYLWWPSVTTLRFSCDEIGLPDWWVLKRFCMSLKHLELSGISMARRMLKLEEPEEYITPFPNLVTLRIVGDRHFVGKILQLFKASPIVDLDVELVSASPLEVKELFDPVEENISEPAPESLLHAVNIAPSNSTLPDIIDLTVDTVSLVAQEVSVEEDVAFTSDERTLSTPAEREVIWSDVLRPFAGTLRRFKLGAMTIPFPPGTCSVLEEFLRAKSVDFRTGNFDETILFTPASEPMYSTKLEDHKKASERGCSIQERGSEVISVLNYALRCVEFAVRDDDPGRLSRVARVITPLSKMLTGLERGCSVEDGDGEIKAMLSFALRCAGNAVRDKDLQWFDKVAKACRPLAAMELLEEEKGARYITTTSH